MPKRRNAKHPVPKKTYVAIGMAIKRTNILCSKMDVATNTLNASVSEAIKTNWLLKDILSSKH